MKLILTLIISAFMMSCSIRNEADLPIINIELGAYMSSHRGEWWYCGSSGDYKIVGLRKLRFNILGELIGITPSTEIDQYYKVKYAIAINQEMPFPGFGMKEKYKMIAFKNYPLTNEIIIINR